MHHLGAQAVDTMQSFQKVGLDLLPSEYQLNWPCPDIQSKGWNWKVDTETPPLSTSHPFQSFRLDGQQCQMKLILGRWIKSLPLNFVGYAGPPNMPHVLKFFTDPVIAGMWW